MTTALDIARRRMAEAEKNRAAYPETAAAVDIVRSWGFPDASLRYTTENGGRGRSIGEGVAATWWPGMAKGKK